MTVRLADPSPDSLAVPLIIIGAGAAGLCAALAAVEAGIAPVILERDATPSGSTALSAGLIPAPFTRFQRDHGIIDDAQSYFDDVMRKSHGEADPAIVRAIAGGAGAAIEWLADKHQLPFSLVHDFDYPGHSARRMHGLPSRSGAELIDRLRQAADDAGATIVTNACVTTLLVDAMNHPVGIEVTRPDGGRETMHSGALILACNGYGGNPALVCRHIPEMAEAHYFGHAGNRGDAIIWGREIGAGLKHLSGYQGHGSVAQPHGILISWAAMSEGGFQVNLAGRRFSDESQGYSEQAAKVLLQDGGGAIAIFDERIATIIRQFADFRQAEASGAVFRAHSSDELAAWARISPAALAKTFACVDQMKVGLTDDTHGRDFRGLQPLVPPFLSVRVSGALFHTQGGLTIDRHARVLNENGGVIPRLFAAGGAAAGISGSRASGYLSGNGLVTAVVLGRIAGSNAARTVSDATDAALPTFIEQSLEA